MKKVLVFLLILLTSSVLFAQQKFALVIGNSRYTGISILNNPVNDANDMETALRALGFAVTKVLDGSRAQMETAVVNFRQRLSASANAYGFFFYAGHGIQSNGENYLIPVDANIPSENSLRDRAVSLQWVLAELNDARNELNIVVLDSCRDNPFSWSRSGTRGLTVVNRAPPGSIVFYATSDGRPAADGTGRNGLFTSSLLNSLRIPDLEITEVIRRTGAAVLQASSGAQIPATYNQFFGTAYLGTRPSPSPAPTPTPTPSPSPAPRPSPTPTPTPAPSPSPTPQSVPQGLEYSVNAGSVTITKYTGNAATLDIPAQIQGLPVTAIGFQMSLHNTSLTSITIPSSVTSINTFAFSFAIRLTSITVDSRNPAYASVDGVLFDKNIRTIIKYPEGKTASTYTIPSSVTSIGDSAFSSNRSLTSIDIPSSVTSIDGGAFANCTSLTSVNIFSSGTIGQEAFYGCTSLTSITIPSSITAIGSGAFYSCNNLTRVSISRNTQVGQSAFPSSARITRRWN